MNFLKKIFDHEYKELEKFKKIADAVIELDDEYSKLSDKQLKAKTKEFQDRLREGETLEDYEEYIILYFQGDLIISHAQEKGESREDCVERLLREYHRKTENLGNSKFETPKSA